jgi:hypothetical protein
MNWMPLNLCKDMIGPDQAFNLSDLTSELFYTLLDQAKDEKSLFLDTTKWLNGRIDITTNDAISFAWERPAQNIYGKKSSNANLTKCIKFQKRMKLGTAPCGYKFPKL